jgi:hypothetical protein
VAGTNSRNDNTFDDLWHPSHPPVSDREAYDIIAHCGAQTDTARPTQEKKTQKKEEDDLSDQ